MNWFQKMAQSLPPSYMGVGHNYRWNEDTNKYDELWAAKDSGAVIVWYHKDGKITEQEYGPHWVDQADAKGRIETSSRRGSVTFDNKDIRVQRKILEDLVFKYPGVRFGIYERGGPFPLQQYWKMIS